jgi:hypothetical protein
MRNSVGARVSVQTLANIIAGLNEAGGIEASNAERFWMKIKDLIILCVTVMIVLLMAREEGDAKRKDMAFPICI